MSQYPSELTFDHQVNLLTTGCKFEGTLELENYSHFNGCIKGTIRCRKDSTFVLGEAGVVEGIIQGDTVVIDGFVRGKVIANKKIVISETGRVVGTIQSPQFAIQFGGYFDGDCNTSNPL